MNFDAIVESLEVRRAVCLALAIDPVDAPCALNESLLHHQIDQLTEKCSKEVRRGFANTGFTLLNWLRDSKPPTTAGWKGEKGNAAKLADLAESIKATVCEMVGRRFWRQRISGWREFACALIALKVLHKHDLVVKVAQDLWLLERSENVFQGDRMCAREMVRFEQGIVAERPDRADFQKDYNGSESKWFLSQQWLQDSRLGDVADGILAALSSSIEKQQTPNDVVAMLNGLETFVQPGAVSGKQRAAKERELRAKDLAFDESCMGEGLVANAGTAPKKACEKKASGKRKVTEIEDDDWHVNTEVPGFADKKQR